MAGEVDEKKPTLRLIDWGTQVRNAWGDEWLKKEVIYRFSNGKEYLSTDASENGIYES